MEITMLYVDGLCSLHQWNGYLRPTSHSLTDCFLQAFLVALELNVCVAAKPLCSVQTLTQLIQSENTVQ